MPLYEYLCKKCHHRFEKIQKFSDPLVKKCPECGGSVEQVISPPAVQFKGSGWYVTDYAKKSSGGDSEKAEKPATETKDAAGKEKSSTTKEASAAESKEKKPAKKAPSKSAKRSGKEGFQSDCPGSKSNSCPSTGRCVI